MPRARTLLPLVLFAVTGVATHAVHSYKPSNVRRLLQSARPTLAAIVRTSASATCWTLILPLGLPLVEILDAQVTSRTPQGRKLLQTTAPQFCKSGSGFGSTLFPDGMTAPDGSNPYPWQAGVFQGAGTTACLQSCSTTADCGASYAYLGLMCDTVTLGSPAVTYSACVSCDHGPYYCAFYSPGCRAHYCPPPPPPPSPPPP